MLGITARRAQPGIFEGVVTMCIVCDIKQAVEASGPNKEDRAKILGLVEKLAEALGDVLEVAQAVRANVIFAANTSRASLK
ncbi:hypothetical protein Kopi_041 [Pseudomonas phage Kopi]|uniref:Uncharacterized protein n=1 Tax=Pseudomonas phage Kopi TaxID=2880993 RepID=A0AAE8Y3U4_9CAUD|nr:hypothetical protein PM397_gp41 [Pseudomonas phage Kopi]UDF60313.1 hypothetical protein Kopi_041 [Pseudomonas phage Kopi]